MPDLIERLANVDEDSTTLYFCFKGAIYNFYNTMYLLNYEVLFSEAKLVGSGINFSCLK